MLEPDFLVLQTDPQRSIRYETPRLPQISEQRTTASMHGSPTESAHRHYNYAPPLETAREFEVRARVLSLSRFKRTARHTVGIVPHPAPARRQQRGIAHEMPLTESNGSKTFIALNALA